MVRNDCRMGLVRFMWRYLDVLGLQPESVLCVHCGMHFADNVVFKTCSFYSPSDSGFICTECAREYQKTHHKILVTESTRIYLDAITTKTPQQVRNIPVSPNLLQEMQSLCFFLIERACGSKLKSLL